MKKLGLLVLIICFFGFVSFVSAEHNITGSVSDSLSGIESNGNVVYLWHTGNQSDNITDVIGISGRSGSEDNYSFDCENLDDPCSLGDNLSIQVIDSGVLSNIYYVEVSSLDVDYVEDFRLNSKPFVNTSNPKNNSVSDTEILLNCSYSDLDSEILDVEIYLNLTGSYELVASDSFSGGDLTYSDNLSDGDYNYYCSASDSVSSVNSSVIDFSVNSSYLDILNVTIEDVVLNINNTKQVSCVARIVDFNGEDNISSVSGVLFGPSSFYEDDEDNNYHYSDSCSINNSFISWQGHLDDSNSVLANCSFDLEYYSEPGLWNCSISVSDSQGFDDFDFTNFNVLELLAFSVPDFIEYGVVDVLGVSSEKHLEIENVGNVDLDIRLSGFAENQGDGFSLGCSQGENILVNYSRYNFSSHSGSLDFAEFVGLYTGLKGEEVLEDVNLGYRKNDVFSEAFMDSYWRVYVPSDVGGVCQGNIMINAVKS